MAGKGGGAWKVAYADFVTAMMAFFLVMWICGQDQKVRRSVSDYFSDPMGSTENGTSKKASRTGSITEFLNTGSVPAEESVGMGKGRRAFSTPREPSTPTKMLHEWLVRDPQANAYWHQQATQQREAARWSREVKEEKKTVEAVAVRQLVQQLRHEFHRDLSGKAQGIYRDLVERSLSDVNWVEIAEDLIGN